MKMKIILAENRGDYISRIDGDEIHGGSLDEATRYTEDEAHETVAALGRGYSVEDVASAGTAQSCQQVNAELWEQYQDEMVNGYGFGHPSEWSKTPMPGNGNGRNFVAFCAKKRLESDTNKALAMLGVKS